MQTLRTEILPISGLEKAQLRIQLSRIQVSSTCNSGKHAEHSEGSAAATWYWHWPSSSFHPGAQSLCAAGTRLVREKEAKGPAQSPEMGEANGQAKHPAPCTHISTGTKTSLTKGKWTPRRRNHSFQILGVKQARQTRLFDTFRSVWKTMQCRLPVLTD